MVNMVMSDDCDGREPFGKQRFSNHSSKSIIPNEVLVEVLLRHEAAQKLRKSHWMLSNSRQSLVKGERLVRHDMTAVLMDIPSTEASMITSDDRDGYEPSRK